MNLSVKICYRSLRNFRAQDNPQETLMTNQQHIPPEWGHYLAGFTDGEGSFVISLRKRPDHTLGWQISFAFSVSQRESYILSQFKKYLGCGSITRRQDGLHTYAVLNPLALQEKIIPFFERFILRSATKKRNFLLFRNAVSLWMGKEKISKEELIKIAKIREELNRGAGRKRKYCIKDMECSFREDPQRPYARVRSFRREMHRT